MDNLLVFTHFIEQNIFLYRAFVACIGISFVCPIIGVFLMLRRMSLIGDALSHAILPGVALGFMFGGMSIIAMALGGLVAGLIVTVLAGVVSRTSVVKEDASFAGFYLTSLAIGVIIISHSGSNLDLVHILFGSILAVGDQGLLLLITVVSFSLIVLAIILRPLVIDIFDKKLLRIYKVNVLVYHLLFLFIVVINLVINFQILGTILVVGLMILPANVAKVLAKSFNMMLVIAILSGIISSVAGLVISYFYDLSTGPTIILVNGTIYILSLIYSWVLQYARQRIKHYAH